MELEKRANKQSILLTLIMYLIFIFNCIAGYTNDKITLTPLLVSVIFGLLNCTALFFVYKANKASGLVKYISLAGLYINHVFLTIATEISPSSFIIFVILVAMSLMFFNKKLTGSALVITASTHAVFTILNMPENITALDMLPSLPVFIGFILASFCSLRIYGEMVKLVKSMRKREQAASGMLEILPITYMKR
ncbi:MAG: hypothetical protein ACM3XR_08600 [Bacillota bacterium]